MLNTQALFHCQDFAHGIKKFKSGEIMRTYAMIIVLIGGLVGCAHAPKPVANKTTAVTHARKDAPERTEHKVRGSEPAEAPEQDPGQEVHQKCSFDSECPLVGVCDFGHCHS